MRHQGAGPNWANERKAQQARSEEGQGFPNFEIVGLRGFEEDFRKIEGIAFWFRHLWYAGRGMGK